MATDATDSTCTAQEELATWHATHPNATFAEMEGAVEAQLDRIRVQLLHGRATAMPVDEHPLCPACGATMKPTTTGKRTLVLRGDQPLELEQSYVACPTCGAGLFPPG